MSGACMDMKTELERVRRERDSLKQQLAEANENAACADMRGALEIVDNAYATPQFNGGWIVHLPKDWPRIMASALSSDAGKDLLERMREAERLLKAVSEDLSVPYPGNLRTVMAKLRNGSALILEDLEDDYHNEGYNQVRQSMTMLRNLKTAIDAYLEGGAVSG